MSEKLKNTIQWTFFSFVLLIFIVGFLIPFCIFVITDNPPDKITDWMNYAGIGLSFISLGLALYSLRASSKSQEKLETSLKRLEDVQQNLNNSLTEVKVISTCIKSSQDRIESRLDAMKNIGYTEEGKNVAAWKYDETGAGE